MRVSVKLAQLAPGRQQDCVGCLTPSRLPTGPVTPLGRYLPGSRGSPRLRLWAAELVNFTRTGRSRSAQDQRPQVVEPARLPREVSVASEPGRSGEDRSASSRHTRRSRVS